MPTRPPKLCAKAGCSALTTERYCKAHRNDGWRQWQAGKTSTQRGYGAAWRKLRKAVLERDRYLCQPCLRSGITREAKQVDHRIAKAEGGTDTMEGLESICIPCHRAKTAREGHRGAFGS